MSLLMEYVDSCCGYDDQGRPAAATQFTFGMMPFAVSENENIEDFTEITTVCQTEAIVSIDIVDKMAKVEFDFSMDVETFADLINEIDFYKEQVAHIQNTLSEYEAELNRAIELEDEEKIEEMDIKFRSLSIPFLLPTIVPSMFSGDVHIGFSEDPKFTFFTSDKVNQLPSKLVMIFDAEALFAEDEEGVYNADEEEEIRMQQEEMAWAAEERKMEEEAYQAQYGYNASDYYDDDDDDSTDSRLSGLRIK